ncbi:hypothetical protein FHS43_004554 [Streptosporangium becharense]|uniref:Uncharacterized protein n=1 Tax=Streptosporangium becharense TaxID=1816182 RepID=A0A7W9MJ80_9ACTN|nr:hypothetical protein [Streptosporangium becharense]MBB2913256.1 hypothetical protein [Streptosporangium becharense]MBB5822239.1 hypothetical protein [Streptosporangium becharense]
MAAVGQYERFDHLVRLGWALHGLGVHTSLVLPVAGQPVLEIQPAFGAPVHITAIRRYCGWVFTWRPWRARLWRRDRWVVADAENAADIIMAEVGG